MTIDEINVLIKEFHEKVRDLKIAIAEKNDYIIIKLDGSIDTFNSQPITKILLEIARLKHKFCVFDMSGISYASSTGVGMFTALLRECTQLNKKMYILQLQNKVREVFDLLGFSSFFTLIDSLDEIGKEIKTIFPLIMKCPECSVSFKIPRSGRFSCKSCKHILIINDEGKLEE